jgi:hypothetical protein
LKKQYIPIETTMERKKSDRQMSGQHQRKYSYREEGNFMKEFNSHYLHSFKCLLIAFKAIQCVLYTFLVSGGSIENAVIFHHQ